MLSSHSSQDWRLLYEAALLEPDAGKLLERIINARTAIFDRIEDSITHPMAGEQAAMDCALRALRRLAETASRSRGAA